MAAPVPGPTPVMIASGFMRIVALKDGSAPFDKGLDALGGIGRVQHTLSDVGHDGDGRLLARFDEFFARPLW